MRTDAYTGEQVPGTLGEYRDVCAALFGEQSKSVAYWDDLIKQHPKGRKEKVLQADSQVRELVFNMETPRE